MFGYELNIPWKLMTLFIKMEVILNTTQDGSVHDALQKWPHKGSGELHMTIDVFYVSALAVTIDTWHNNKWKTITSLSIRNVVTNFCRDYHADHSLKWHFHNSFGSKSMKWKSGIFTPYGLVELFRKLDHWMDMFR